MQTPKVVMFFNNGNTAVLSENEQIPELQKSWIVLYAEFLEIKGVDPETLELRLPYGPAKYFRTAEGGWSWRFTDKLHVGI